MDKITQASIHRTLPLSSLCIHHFQNYQHPLLLLQVPNMHPLVPCPFALLLLLLLLLSLSTQSLAHANNDQSIDQVINPHRYSPFRDNHNSSVSDNEGMMRRRIIDTIESEITAAKYSYLMALRVKTTAGSFVDTYAIPDTGSDLIWLNEKGCSGDACHCGGKAADRCVGKPTIKLLHCREKQCDDMRKVLNLIKKKGDQCPKGNEYECEYDIAYSDKSSTTGVLAKSEFSFPISGGGRHKYYDINTAFGVSRESKGNLEPKSQGIVGLGQGELSLFGQYRRFQFKFSYCLPQYHPKPSESKKSKLIFGSQVTTSDKFTPLLTKHVDPICEYRYCVHLARISLKGDSTDKEDKITVSEGRKTNVMVIDTGSTFTLLTDNLFPKFLQKVKHAIGHDINPKPFGHYDNCFKEESAKKLEKVSFEFDGTTMELKRENFFDRYTHDDDEGKTSYLCLTVKDRDKKNNIHEKPYLRSFGRENGNPDPKVHLLGNRAQMDFKVAIDIPSKKVSFDATKECGEQNVEELVSSTLRLEQGSLFGQEKNVPFDSTKQNVEELVRSTLRLEQGSPNGESEAAKNAVPEDVTLEEGSVGFSLGRQLLTVIGCYWLLKQPRIRRLGKRIIRYRWRRKVRKIPR